MKHCLASAAFLALLAAPAAALQGHWPQWRGPLGTGESPDANPPLRWSDGENIRWKVEVPGRGKGTPIAWGERIYLLTAEPAAESQAASGGDGRRGIEPSPQRFVVLALNRADGSVAWKRVATELVPHEGTHKDGTWASASAVTDGKRLFAHFGSPGVFAYDLEGNKLWEKKLGQMQTRNAFGEGSSPALYGDTLVVQWDHEGPDFIVALDAATGKERWRAERDEPTSWATPLIVEVGGKPQIVTSGTNRVRSYDLETGALLWECKGLTVNAIPSPVHADGTAYLMSGFRGNVLLAIKLAGAKGDISDSDAILWRSDRDTPYVPSPLVYKDRLYFYKSNDGIVSALDARTGERVFGPERLQAVANVYASPVAAAGRIYLVGRDGETEVLDAGLEYKVLATNVLDDAFDASPALVEDEIYLRGAKYLYCIAEASAAGGR